MRCSGDPAPQPRLCQSPPLLRFQAELRCPIPSVRSCGSPPSFANTPPTKKTTPQLGGRREHRGISTAVQTSPSCPRRPAAPQPASAEPGQLSAPLGCCRGAPRSPGRGGRHSGGLTREMVSGVLKSLPPTSRKPQGEGPVRATVWDMLGGLGRAATGSARGRDALLLRLSRSAG